MRQTIPIKTRMTDPMPQGAPVPSHSAGQLLQQTRKQLQLSLDELAAETRIPRAVLEALEADRDPANQAPVFVRGFYRRCARALGLSEQAVVSAYEARVGAPAPVKTEPSEWVSVARKTSSPVPGGPWAMVAVLAVIVCVILVMALSRNKKSPPQASEGIEHAPLIQRQASTAVHAEPESAAGTTGSAGDGSAAETPTSTQNTPPAEAAFTSPLQPTLPGPVAVAPATAAEPSAAEQAADVAVVAAVPRQLVIEYTQPCWTSVTDAEGDKLLQGIFNAGDRKEIVGEPPYRVVLGFAPGARLFYEGQPFDMSSQLETGKLTGRITVPLED